MFLRLHLFLLALVILQALLPKPAPAIAEAWTAPTEPGISLPLQDYVGDTEVANAVESFLALHLSNQFSMADPGPLRDELRRLRIRAAVRAAPETLNRLAEQLEVGWFVSAAIHEVVHEPIPRITVSLRAFAAGSDQLGWAQVEAMTLADGVAWLGIRPAGDMTLLIRTVTARLADGLATAGDRPVPRSRFGRARTEFLRQPHSPSPDGAVAVVPFNTMAADRTTQSVATATAALQATLIEFGYEVTHPGVVDQALREQGKYNLGEVNSELRLSLNRSANVAWVMTGAVEIYEERPSSRDGPWVALSARLVEASNGSILWMGSLDHQGADTKSAFEQGVTHSAGRLTQEITRSLIADVAHSRRSNP